MTAEPSATNESVSLQPQAIEFAEDFRRRKKTTLLAIVFTDIADSTALREKLGEIRYEAERESFDAEFERIVCRDDGGCIVKGTGDGALVIFDEPSVAVQRALEIQDALGTHNLFRLRIGIDLGQVSLKSAFGLKTDVFGRHVNRAARIQSLAEPGHVLTSFSIYDCAVGWLDTNEAAWHNHGSHQLRGFDNEVLVYESYDPRVSRPQELGTPELVADLHREPMFSRAGFGMRYLPLSREEWNKTKLNVGRDYRVIEPEPEWHSYGDDDPLRDYAGRIRRVIEVLKRSVPEEVSIAWIDDSPERNRIIIDLLRTTGMVVSVNDPELYAKTHIAVIAAMASERQSEAVLDKLGIASVSASKGAVRFVYAPASVLATLEDELIDMRVALTTSGMVTLLSAIHAYLGVLSTHLPMERVERPPLDVDIAAILSGKARRRSLLERLMDALRRLKNFLSPRG